MNLVLIIVHIHSVFNYHISIPYSLSYYLFKDILSLCTYFIYSFISSFMCSFHILISYTHSYTHSHTHSCTHFIYSFMYTHSYFHSRILIHILIHVYSFTYTHSYTHSISYTHSCILIHIFIHVYSFIYSFTYTHSYTHSCFMNTSIHIAFLIYIYILSYHVFQLTLTKRLVHLVQQFNFQTRCGHQMPLNSICLDSRLNELSIESKNTHNGVVTKDLCKLQA